MMMCELLRKIYSLAMCFIRCGTMINLFIICSFFSCQIHLHVSICDILFPFLVVLDMATDMSIRCSLRANF